eukprot:scaffold297115_cov26-Tisochrysis_lutea.AAC.1
MPAARSMATSASSSAMRPSSEACETAAAEAEPESAARSASSPSTRAASALFSLRMPEHCTCSSWNFWTSDALSSSEALSFCSGRKSGRKRVGR